MESRSAIAAAGKKFRTKNVSRQVQKIVISPIKEMSILADLLEEKNLPADRQAGADIISFGQGIPYWDTPAHIKKAIARALKNPDTAKYTLEPGITELRERIGRDLEKRKGIRRIAAKKEIMVTAGCQEAVDCALRTVIDEGDEVLVPEPAFASHIEQVIQFGGVPRFVPMDEEHGWRLDPKACERRITRKTRAILFSNPSNPTGAVFSKKDIAALVRLAAKRDLVIIADETYDFLTYDGVTHFSPASVPGAKGRVILCGSFSKKYAMTGYRVGFAYADEGLIDHMLKVHDALVICAPAISQKGAIAALKGPQECVRDAVARLAANRARMCAELDRLSDILSYEKPMGAYYILARVNPVRGRSTKGTATTAPGRSASNGMKRPSVNSFKLAIRILNEAKVVVIPGAAFGPSGEGHIRFSFAGEPANIARGFARLAKWFARWRERGYTL